MCGVRLNAGLVASKWQFFLLSEAGGWGTELDKLDPDLAMSLAASTSLVPNYTTLLERALIASIITQYGWLLVK